MERAASALGTRFAVPEIVVGGLVLAAVTSLPNAVAAVYLAARGRGAATLSIAATSVPSGMKSPSMVVPPRSTVRLMPPTTSSASNTTGCAPRRTSS